MLKNRFDNKTSICTYMESCDHPFERAEMSGPAPHFLHNGLTGTLLLKIICKTLTCSLSALDN